MSNLYMFDHSCLTLLRVIIMCVGPSMPDHAVGYYNHVYLTTHA